MQLIAAPMVIKLSAILNTANLQQRTYKIYHIAMHKPSIRLPIEPASISIIPYASILFSLLYLINTKSEKQLYYSNTVTYAGLLLNILKAMP